MPRYCQESSSFAANFTLTVTPKKVKKADVPLNDVYFLQATELNLTLSITFVDPVLFLDISNIPVHS